MMTEQMTANFDNLFERVQKKECSLYAVLDKVADELVKDKLFGTIYADIIGRNKKDKQRSIFKEALVTQLPHVTYNGKHGKTVAVDWVEPNEKSVIEPNIKSYRYSAETEIVKVDTCVGSITAEVEKPRMEVHQYESGFVKEIPALDAEGKSIKDKVEVTLIPREKGIWGFTKEVSTAIKATINLFI